LLYNGGKSREKPQLRVATHTKQADTVQYTEEKHTAVQYITQKIVHIR
jgi:hypothetical protein